MDDISDVGVRGPHRVRRTGGVPSRHERSWSFARGDRHPRVALGAESFVGRTAELGVLREALAAALEGRGRLVLVGGIPGVGRTRLLSAFSDEARAAGVPVAAGSAHAEIAPPPFWPWIQVLRALLHQETDDGAGPPAAALDLIRAHEAGATLRPMGEEQRFRLCDGVATFLRGRAQHAGLVVALDDVHVADLASLLLLRFLARELHGSRILVVGTRVGGDPPGAVGNILADLHRMPGAVSLALLRLPYRDAPALLEQTIGGPPDRLGWEVLALAEGNPLFLRELMAEAAATGTTTIPPTLRRIIERRLAVVSRPTRRMLTAAAALGREFDVVALARLHPGSSERLLRPLCEAARAQLVEALGSEPVRYRFVQSLVRDVLLGRLTAARGDSARRRGEKATLPVPPPAPPPSANAAEGGLTAADGAGPPIAVLVASLDERALTAGRRPPETVADQETHLQLVHSVVDAHRGFVIPGEHGAAVVAFPTEAAAVIAATALEQAAHADARFRALRVAVHSGRAIHQALRFLARLPGGVVREVDNDRDGRWLFRREGDYWTIASGGNVTRVRDMKGLGHLAELLRRPGREVHVLDLLGIRSASSGVEKSLDGEARRQYRGRLQQLRQDLAEAEGLNDLGRAAAVTEEIGRLEEHLASAVGLGGRGRRAPMEAERARLMVTQRIRAALQRVLECHPNVGRHLVTHVRTGYLCVYVPDPERSFHWVL